ncbi:MAG: hypothetical protein D6800_07620 [Candidatus Zixiibacteriota bacterium]|nr:MAG: hypothetical protein D6800_07620 [candidate division Zixibacteria bacterium]
MPAVLCVRAYIERALAFPQLAGCNSHWETWFYDEDYVRLRFVTAPADWPDAEQGRVAEVVFEPAEFASFGLDETYPDWRGYSRLQLTIFDPDDTDLTAFIRVQDRLHNQEYNDRYNSSFRLHPGKNVVSFPLAEIVAAPAGRRMDLSRMSSLAVFLAQPARPETLYIDDIRLR